MTSESNNAHDAPSLSATAQPFSEILGALLMDCEELRRELSKNGTNKSGCNYLEHLMNWQQDVELILSHLLQLSRLADDCTDPAIGDLLHHGLVKTVTTVQEAVKCAFELQEPTACLGEKSGVEGESIDTIRREGQGAVARMVEVNLLLLQMAEERRIELGNEALRVPKEVIQSYASYQRQILRQRARPCVAKLVQARQEGRMEIQNLPQHQDDVHDEQGDDRGLGPVVEHYHAPVMAAILGDAAALIHPLLLWITRLPSANEKNVHPMVVLIHSLCQQAIETVDEQAQTLVKTVSDWFWQDRPIEEWLQKSASSETIQGQHDIAVLDALMEEMAYCCQILSRYEALLIQTSGLKLQSIIKTEVLPEWTWKYASLERYLAMQQWNCALKVASPLEIVIGTLIRVPSIVEDAHYLSTRALERAASTRSLQAVGTVAHAVSHDVWSVEMEEGVHHALMEKRGCWVEPIKATKDASPAKSMSPPRSGFASALLDALDDDIDTTRKSEPSKSPSRRNPAAPLSGGILNSFIGAANDQLNRSEMDSTFCMLNGVFAASAACNALVSYLDYLLYPDEDGSDMFLEEDQKAKAMIQLAREDLFGCAKAYDALLREKVNLSISTWCGSLLSERLTPSSKSPCLWKLQAFLWEEDYHLNERSFLASEADERLEQNMMIPLHESLFLSDLPNKADIHVMQILCDCVSKSLVNIVLAAVIDNEKKFTDWGSLLLSKQVRLLQTFVLDLQTKARVEAEGVATLPLNYPIWETLTQIVTVLQLEKPADWLPYSATSSLSVKDLQKALSKRVDFSADAVKSVVNIVADARKNDAATL